MHVMHDDDRTDPPGARRSRRSAHRLRMRLRPPTNTVTAYAIVSLVPKCAHGIYKSNGSLCCAQEDGCVTGRLALHLTATQQRARQLTASLHRPAGTSTARKLAQAQCQPHGRRSNGDSKSSGVHVRVRARLGRESCVEEASLALRLLHLRQLPRDVVELGICALQRALDLGSHVDGVRRRSSKVGGWRDEGGD